MWKRAAVSLGGLRILTHTVQRGPLVSCPSELRTREHAPAFCFHTGASEKGWERGLLQSSGYLKMIVLAEELQKCGDYYCQLLSAC